MQFDQPYFVTPHAVKRFQERVAQVSAAEAIRALQAMMQDQGTPVDVDTKGRPVYAGWYESRSVYIPVVEGEGAWPSIPTVFGEESALHGKRCKRGYAR